MHYPVAAIRLKRLRSRQAKPLPSNSNRPPSGPPAGGHKCAVSGEPGAGWVGSSPRTLGTSASEPAGLFLSPGNVAPVSPLLSSAVGWAAL